MATITTLDGGNISSDRYVEITSGVGGKTAFDTKQLILRLFTTNELFPTNSVVTFTSESDVLSFMNEDSTADEYLQTAYYLNYTSKAIKQPAKISIARWADEDTSAQVYGAEVADLDDLITYTSASLDVTLDGATYSATGIDLSSASSYADVATSLQLAIIALDASLASTTVTYNATSSGFNLDTNGTADGTLSFVSATSGFLSDLGWDSLATFSDGISAQTVTSVLTTTEQISNDFLSISFIDDLDMDQEEEVATWVSNANFKYMNCARSTKSNAQSYYDALVGYGGTAVTLYDADVTDEYPWLHPAAEAAAVDPDASNAFPNFMYNTDDALSELITNDDDADTYDALRMNYMGRTQEAGTERVWYQRGVLMGGDTDALTMSVYVAEAWLKSELKSSFLSMFNALPGIVADTSGKSIVRSYLDAAVQAALPDSGNGMISVGKDLTTTQKAYIYQITGDDNAWQNVKNEGYWYDITFDSYIADSGVTEYEAEYTLVYAKADKIRKVTGTHVLI